MPRALVLLGATLLLVPSLLTAQDSTRTKPKVRRLPDVISAEEIADAPAGAEDAYALVERLRPQWLRTRGVGSMVMGGVAIVVYVNDAKRGDPESLRGIPRTGVKEIRHLNGTDASQRFGLNHENGAILVTLR